MRELAAAAPERVRRVFVAEGPRARGQVAALIEAGVPPDRVRVVPKERLDERLPRKQHRGVLAEAAPVREAAFDDLLATGGVLVALDGVEDPGNLGAIVRTAEFFGAQGLFAPKDRSAWVGPVAVRASAGATERLPLCRVVNLARALDACREAGYWIYGTVVDGGQRLDEVANDPHLPARRVVVLGGEHAGLRRRTREHCDVLVTIPRVGRVGSLNVAAAAAVVLARLGLPAAGAT